MSLGQELRDFTAAFKAVSGAKTARENSKSMSKYRDAATRALEADLTPEALETKRRREEADLANVRSTTGYRDTQRSALELESTPEAVDRRNRATEADIAGSESLNDFRDAERRRIEQGLTPGAIDRKERADEASIAESVEKTRKDRLANDKLKLFNDSITQGKKDRINRAHPDRALDADVAPEPVAIPVPGTPGPQSSVSEEDRDMAIRTIVGEAHGEPDEGKQAVANVILNRQKSGRWGGSLTDVVLAKGQFEPWSTRRNELLGISKDSPEYRGAAMAFAAAEGGDDVTGGATHFLNEKVVLDRTGKLPAWTKGQPLTELGRHAFYAPEGKVSAGGGTPRPRPDIGPPKGKPILESAHQAVKEGLIFAMAQIGIDPDTMTDTGVPVPGSDRLYSAFLNGEYGAPGVDVEAAENIVVAQAESQGINVSDAERSMFTLGALRDWYLAEGDPEKAKAAVASALGYYQILFSQYSAVAKAAVEKGDIDGATKAAARAYAAVPDGYEVTFEKVKQEFADADPDEKSGPVKYRIKTTDMETGEVQTEVLLTPEEMGSFAMNVTPADFPRYIVAAAGAKSEAMSPSAAAAMGPGADWGGMSTEEGNLVLRQQEAARAAAAANQVSIGDRGKVSELIGEAAVIRFDQLGEALLGEENPELVKNTIMSSAEMLFGYNKENNIPASTAVDATIELLFVNPQNPEATTFEATAHPQDPAMVVVNYAGVLGIPPIHMPRVVYQGLMHQRAGRVAAASANLHKFGARKARDKGIGSRIDKAVGATIDAVRDSDPKKTLGKFPMPSMPDLEAIPGRVQRGISDVLRQDDERAR